MAAVAADTHAIVRYLLVSPALSAPAMQALDGAIVASDPVFVASISLVELRYLIERGRVPQLALDQLEGAITAPDSPVALVPLDLEITRAIGGAAGGSAVGAEAESANCGGGGGGEARGGDPQIEARSHRPSVLSYSRREGGSVEAVSQAKWRVSRAAAANV